MRWLDALVGKLGPHPIQSGRHAYPPSFPPSPYPEQEVMRWLNALVGKLGPQPTKEQLTEYVQDTLARGNVVPGYGHGVLRKTDPRYTCQVR